ncbi:MAG: glycosyl hydrolase 53 family protein, partial [Candidatus Cryptobacteroides sp.]
MKRIALILLVAALCGCAKQDNPSNNGTPSKPSQVPEIKLDKFYKGTTMCFASYMQDLGLVYRENGVATDPYKSVRSHGANIVRLQLDNVAFPEYGGVTIDWQTYDRVLADIRKAKAAGMDVFLTLKPDYDKFDSKVTDHNNLPEAWAGKSETEVGNLLYEWIYNTLKKLHEADADPLIVAVGNEVNVGFLKPASNSLDASRTGRLLMRGFAAVRQFSSDFQVPVASALHIANPAKAESFISSVTLASKFDYDIIALSYYPGSAIGHTLPYNTVASTVSALKQKYSKEVMVI